jgi:hypothetical protein
MASIWFQPIRRKPDDQQELGDVGIPRQMVAGIGDVVSNRTMNIGELLR